MMPYTVSLHQHSDMFLQIMNSTRRGSIIVLTQYISTMKILNVLLDFFQETG